MNGSAKTADASGTNGQPLFRSLRFPTRKRKRHGIPRRGTEVHFLISSLLAILFLFPACGPVKRKPEPTNLVWPQPPNPPRIKYIQSIYSEDDIGRVYSLREKLFGKDYFDTLSRPYGVYAHRGKIAVTDLSVRAIFVFDLTAKRLSVLGEEGALQIPSSAVTDTAGITYVADTGASKIAVYDAKGHYATAYPMEGGKPVALAINDRLGRLYAVDRASHKVIVHGLDGIKLFEFGNRGGQDGQFNIPMSIAVDGQGDVYVLDSGNFRVQIFTSEGKFISKFGEVGDRQGSFANPKSIAVDSDGHIYVTDAAFSNFQIFDRKGNHLLFVGTLGPSPGQMHLPSGISIDENDRIYVADQFNRRIQVFQYIKAPD